MSREQAKADILEAATSPDILGDTVLIDGSTFQAVKRALSREELPTFSGFDVALEGIRLSIGISSLGWKPTVGGGMRVDGEDFIVRAIHISGLLMKITLTRNVG